jgi:type I restriction enzyme, S subunit
MDGADLITRHLDTWIAAQTPKPNGGRWSGNHANGRNCHGTKKLRELILDLAVQGKLVPQDPDDEPASELLKKIAEEKERLIKEGKIKKQKPLPKIREEEKPFELPKGWEWARLGSISQINPRNEAEDDLLTSFIPMTLISTSHKGEHGQEIRKWGEVKKGYTHFVDGDIGIAKITPCFQNSKAVVFSELENGIGAGTTELHIARPYGSTLFPRYVLLFLKSPRFLNLGEARMTGTAGQQRVPKDFFLEIRLPLPPLTEQHRIIAKVDELMTLCDALKDRLNKAGTIQVQLADAIVEKALNSA